jgi:diaminohydroxyphosphoribosylaminopyrimidine deaminase/5-amino-6-(5-phosphoribosylamino)uracil reductase
LTTRLERAKDGRDPLRIVLDSQLRSDPASRIFHQDSPAETWIFCGEDASTARQAVLEKNGARVFRVRKTGQGHIDLHAMLTLLAKKNILSLLVEGGATVLGSFLTAHLVDEVYLFIAPFFIGELGEPLLKGYSILNQKDARRLVHVAVEQAGDDCLIHGYFQDPVGLFPTPCENGPGLKSESSG